MSSVSKAAVHLTIKGRVQGVGFRYFVQGEAQKLHLGGWVRNLPQGHVEAYVEGPRTDLEALIARVHQGPPLSYVESVMATWTSSEGSSAAFFIR